MKKLHSPTLQSLSDLLFPRSCLGCNRYLNFYESTLCITCQIELPQTHFQKNNSLEDFESDILVPCAKENVIDQRIARKIKTKLIIEAANGPVTYNADQILNKVKKDKVNLDKDFYVFTGSTVGVIPIQSKGLYTGKIDKLGSVKAIIS